MTSRVTPTHNQLSCYAVWFAKFCNVLDLRCYASIFSLYVAHAIRELPRQSNTVHFVEMFWLLFFVDAHNPLRFHQDLSSLTEIKTHPLTIIKRVVATTPLALRWWEWSRRGELYCCLLPQCEALRACRSGFPIATIWCCDQDVKVVPGSAFTQRTCDWCGSLLKGGGVIATTPLELCWSARFTTNGMCAKNNTIYMWHEQAIIEWSRRVNSLVACCPSAKLCALAARAFRLQQCQLTLLAI